MSETLAEFRAREAEIAREWTWLNDALNSVARAMADNEDARAFRLLHAQAMAVGQRRVELSLRIAELEGPTARCCGENTVGSGGHSRTRRPC